MTELRSIEILKKSRCTVRTQRVKLSCRSPFVFPLYAGLLVRVSQRQITNPCRDSLNTDIWPGQSLLRRAPGQTGQRTTPSVATNDATLPLHDGEGAEVIQRNRKVCSTPAKSHAARTRHVVRAGVQLFCVGLHQHEYPVVQTPEPQRTSSGSGWRHQVLQWQTHAAHHPCRADYPLGHNSNATNPRHSAVPTQHPPEGIH